MPLPPQCSPDSRPTASVRRPGGSPAGAPWADSRAPPPTSPNQLGDREEPEPIDAQVVIRPDDVPLVLPGSDGVVVDDGALPDAVWAAANSVTRTAPLPVRDGVAPAFTTE